MNYPKLHHYHLQHHQVKSIIENFRIRNEIFISIARPSPPPPLPLYDPEEYDESSNTATHLQDRIGEYEDMELDDLDEPEPTSTDELTSSTTFIETQSLQINTVPPPPVSSLYDDADAEEINIPSESNQVSCSCLYI